MTIPDPNTPVPPAAPPPVDPKQKQADDFSQQFWSSYDGKYAQGYKLPASDPSADFAAQFNQSYNGQYAGQKPDPNAQKIPDAQWDYKTATVDKNGAPLPYGAVGFDPNGNAYYGQGVTGWLNGAVSRITDPGAKQAKFDLTKPNTDLASTVGNIANNVGQVGGLTDTFGVDSPLTPVLRTLKEAVGGAFQAFSLPSLLTERVAGTANELLKDNLGDSPLGIAASKAIGIAFLGGVPGLLQGAPGGEGQVRAKNLQEAWDASAITYSSFFDASKRDQLIRGVRDGQNPELLAMQLENPTAEFWGQLILDPTWIFGMATKGAKAAEMLETTASKLTQTGAVASEEVAGIVDKLSVVGKTLDEANAAGKVIDEATATGHLADVSTAITKAVETERAGVATYKAGFFSRLTASQQAIYAKVTGDHVGWLVNTMQNLGKNPEEIGQALYHTAMLASEDLGQRNIAMSYVLKNHPVPKMALSEQGIQTANVLWHSIGGDAEKYFSAFAKAQEGGLEGIVKFGYERMASASKDMFPSVTEMRTAAEAVTKGSAVERDVKLASQYKTLSPGVQAAERFASSLLPTQYRKMVGTMTGVYLSNPGYVMRNIFNNAFTGLVDQGGKFLAENGKIYATDLTGATNFAAQDLNKMVGQVVGIGGLGKSGNAVDEGFKFSQIIPKWADATERNAGAMVMRASVQDSLKKLLQPGKFLPDVGSLIEKGMTPEQATMFTRAILDSNGDVDKALMRFRGTTSATGAVNAWQDTSRLLSPDMRSFLSKHFTQDGVSLHDGFLEALHGTYTSVDDAVKSIFDSIRKPLAETAKGTVNDAIAISDKHIGAGIAADMSHATEQGLLTPGSGDQFSAMLQAGQNLENHVRNTATLIAGASDGSAKNFQYIKDVLSAITETGGAVAQETKGITDKAWEIKDLSNARKMTPEGWSQFLGRPVAAGEDTKALLNEVFQKRFESVSSAWHSYYEGLKLRTDNMYKELSASITVPANAEAVQAAMKNGDGLFDHYKQVQQAWFDGKNLVSGPKPPDLINQALTTAEKAAQEVGNTSNVEAVIKQAIDGGMNEFQIKNHFAKPDAGPMTPETIAEYAKSKGVEISVAQEAQAAEKVRVPYAGNAPSAAQFAHESIRGMEPELQRMEQFVRENWGQTMGSFGEGADKALADYANAAKPLIAQARKISLDVAQGARDFSFLNYNDKRGFDAVAGYVAPLEFWPSRTYSTWAQRIWTDPGVLASYGKYKGYMEKIHADMPEFYKYQINPAELLGMHTDNPIFFNLEATLWPLNGLTGVDFNDPYKRTDWWSALLDDMGKVGPGVATPITAMTAVAQYMRGEHDAAARTAGRLFPVTAQIKAALSLANVKLPDTPFTHGNELDPFVNFFGKDGSDPYEQRRIGGSALPAMVADGKITMEQAIDAADKASGPIWEEAKALAAKDRAGTTLASWGLGVGWKGRTATDLKIDKFYQEYLGLSAKINGGQSSPDATRKAFDDLRTKYPFMDLVILSKKDGPDRDRAYAYNTLGRIPPGDSGALAKAAGISSDLIQKFYDSSGRMNNWPQSDKDKFMAGMSDLAAVLAAPDDATKQSWSTARTAYNALKDQITAKFGADIQDKQSAYFAIGNETQKQRDLQNDYLKLHPEVKDAMDFRTAQIAQTPELTQYYGGLAAIEKYYSMQMYADIKSKLGDDIFDKFNQYGSLKLTDANGAKAFYRQNNLDQYAKIKSVWQDKINMSMAQVGSMFVEGAPVQLRTDIPSTTGTSAIQQTLQPKPQRSWQDWQTLMPQELQRMVIDYFNTGKKVPSSGSYYLDKIAKDYGFSDTNALLQSMGSSLLQGQNNEP